MTDTEHHRQAWSPSHVLTEIRPLLNPATVQGGIAVLAGTLVLGLPGLSVITMKIAFGIAVLGMAVLDIAYAVTGRGWSLGPLAPSERLPRTVRPPRRGVHDLLALPDDGRHRRPRRSLLRAARRGHDHPRRLAEGRAPSRRTGRCGVRVTRARVPRGPDARDHREGLILTSAVLAVIVGLILLTHGIRAAGTDAGPGIGVVHDSVTHIVWDWIRDADVGPNWRREVADSLYLEPPGRAGKLVAWWVMLLLSVAIATFAVLQDSTAVVIGAMLIAPLMTPILGLSGAHRQRMGSPCGVLPPARRPRRARWHRPQRRSRQVGARPRQPRHERPGHESDVTDTARPPHRRRSGRGRRVRDGQHPSRPVDRGSRHRRRARPAAQRRRNHAQRRDGRTTPSARCCCS